MGTLAFFDLIIIYTVLPYIWKLLRTAAADFSFLFCLLTK